MASSIGQRVSEQRKAFGFTVAELAGFSGLAGKRLGEIEGGRNPTAFELEALARALAVDVHALLLAGASLPKRSVARFRAPLGVTAIAAVDVRLLAKAAEVGRIGASLAGHLGRDWSAIVQQRSIVPVRPNAEPWRQGYQLGARARENLVPGRDPLDSVQRVFESLGIHVAFVEFMSQEIESASLFESGSLPVVLLNRASTRVSRELSRRAILAHELCHLLHDGGERDLLTVISRENDHADFEMRANGFAPSFIAPQHYVSVEGQEAKAKVLQLAYNWGFTYEGAVWHAKNIELIDDQDAERLIAERRSATVQPMFEGPVERTPVSEYCEPSDLSSLVHGLVSDLVHASHEAGIISRGRAREILTMR